MPLELTAIKFMLFRISSSSSSTYLWSVSIYFTYFDPENSMSHALVYFAEFIRHVTPALPEKNYLVRLNSENLTSYVHVHFVALVSLPL
jgi:hypothetical protein